MKAHNYVTAAAALGLGCFVLAAAASFPREENDTMSAAFWPEMLAIFMLALGGALAVATLVDKGAGIAVGFFATAGQKKAWFAVCLMLCYAAGIKVSGFYAANALFVPAMAYLIGERDTTRLLVLDIGANVFVYVVFTVFLHIRLPGPLFG